MQAARRLYLYLMSGITLAVIATGLVLLLRVVLHGVFPDPYGSGYGGYDNSREQLSQAIAMLGVGTPVWAVHWWLVQRGLRASRPGHEAERGSSIRALYMTAALLVSLLVWVSMAASMVAWVVTNLIAAVPEYSGQDPRGAVTAGVPAFAVWLYHGLVRRRDLGVGPVSGAAAWVPRLYLYGISMVAGYVGLTQLSSILASAIPAADGVYDDYFALYLSVQVVTAIVWGLVWLGHWTYATRLANDPGWRGTEERVSRTRVATFVIIIVVAAVSTLGDLAAALTSALRPLLPSSEFSGASEVQLIVARLISATVWAVIWYAHLRALRREPAAADPLRALHQERLVSHGVAATALAIGGAGASWVLGLLVDVLLGGQRTGGTFGSQNYEFAQWLPLAVVGLAVWAWSWRGVVARRRLDPTGEANSTIRRTFLYLTLGVALVAGLSAAALILYRFVGEAVGAGSGGNLVSELSTPLGVFVAAAAALAYHGLALRSDQALAAVAAADVAPAGEVAPVGSVVASGEPGSAADALAMPQRRHLTLTGPADADLDAALAAARAALPAGIEIVSEEG